MHPYYLVDAFSRLYAAVQETQQLLMGETIGGNDEGFVHVAFYFLNLTCGRHSKHIIRFTYLKLLSDTGKTIFKTKF